MGGSESQNLLRVPSASWLWIQCDQMSQGTVAMPLPPGWTPPSPTVTPNKPSISFKLPLIGYLVKAIEN